MIESALKRNRILDNKESPYYLRSENISTINNSVIGYVTFDIVSFKGCVHNIYKVSNIPIDYNVYSEFIFCFEI